MLRDVVDPKHPLVIFANSINWEVIEKNIKLLYLPSYSPNLNLIERFWKYLKEKICTTYYEHFGEFKKAITDFLDNIGKYKDDLISLLAPNFHIMDTRIL